jgi:hypothetical protein
MSRVAFVLSASVLMSWQWSCSNGDPAPQVQYASDGGPADGPSVACNMLVNDGPHVVPVNQPTSPPAPLGGSISDGTYVLTTYNIFIGPDGQPPLQGDFWASSIMTVTSTTMQTIEGYRMGGLDHLPGTARTYTFTVSGTAINLAETCPKMTPAATTDFTATPNEFRLYVSGPSWTTEEIFTKR